MRATLSYAKAHWSEILTAVEAGHPCELTKSGKVIAILVPANTEIQYLGGKGGGAAETIETGNPPGIPRESRNTEITGVLRPAPADAFPPDRSARREAPEHPAFDQALRKFDQAERLEPPTAPPAPEHKKTAPAPAKRLLTLADILRAS